MKVEVFIIVARNGQRFVIDWNSSEAEFFSEEAADCGHDPEDWGMGDLPKSPGLYLFKGDLSFREEDGDRNYKGEYSLMNELPRLKS